ncbi:hypothetical protein HYS97_02325 [Candidatus Daviesbacteria bacterium]|nr:hypothetical protein [Candidatus Daviesbacteria bacterium]
MSHDQLEPYRQKAAQIFAQNLELRTQKPTRAILNHLEETNPGSGLPMLRSRLQGILKPQGLNEVRAWVVVSGLTGVSKSSFIGQLGHELDEEYREAMGEDIPAPLYTFALREAITLSRKRGKISDNVLQGQIDPKGYQDVAYVQDRVRALARDYLPGSWVVFDECILDTENIDSGHRLIGVPRANLASLRRMGSYFGNLFLVLMSADEKFRQDNVRFKEEMSRLTPEQVVLEQKQRGIVGDKRPPKKVQDSYVRAGNVATSRQQESDVANIAHQLIVEGVWRDLPEEYYMYHVEGLRAHFGEFPQSFTQFLRRRLHPRLAAAILPEEATFPTRLEGRVVYLHNTRQKGMRRDELRGWFDQRSLLDALKAQAASGKNPDLIYGLRKIEVLK